MKHLFLILFSLLLVLFPTYLSEKSIVATQTEECCLCEENSRTDLVHDMQSDVLYDDNAIALLATYDCEKDVTPCRLNQWGQQLRVLVSRIQFKSQSIVSSVKKLTHLLSAYLTTLINHTSQVYSSINLCCWQYAVDCYVFAFRQIII